MATHQLFVYGTLKRGQPNEEQLGPEHGVAKFGGLAQTVKKWPLVIGSSCNIPYMLDVEGTGNQIIGEIYEVDDKMLQHCDEFERCPEYYQRITIRVQLMEDSAGSKVEGDEKEVSVYVLRGFKDFMLELPYLENYDSYGSHGLEYESRKERLRDYANHRSEVMKP